MSQQPANARHRSLLLQATLALAIVLVLCVPRGAVAQHRHGGGGSPGGGGLPGRGGGVSDGAGAPRVGQAFSGDAERLADIGRSRSVAGPHAGLQVGPPGRWWDDKHFVKQLRLSQDQQRKLDGIFEQNRTTLVNRYEALQVEQQRMDGLAHARTLDENALFAQIDRIAAARADLDKATTHYLFQIRSELDTAQIAQLEQKQ